MQEGRSENGQPEGFRLAVLKLDEGQMPPFRPPSPPVPPVTPSPTCRRFPHARRGGPGWWSAGWTRAFSQAMAPFRSSRERW